MSEKENIETPVEDGQTIEQPTVGELLKTAREAAGLTIADIAGHLKLSLPQLQALENNDFERLPGPVFIRGFARSYARFLQLDEAPLLAALARQLPRPAPAEQIPDPSSPIAYDSKPLPWRLIGGALIVLIVAAMAGWWLWGGSGDGRTDTAVSEQDPNVLAPMMTEQAASDADTASMPTALAASAPVGSASAPATESVPAGQSVLSIKANAAVWMSVHDASGTRLMNATLATGEEKTLNGKPPLKVRVSNINKLTLSYNNQPVDLNSYKRGQRLSARFELK